MVELWMNQAVNLSAGQTGFLFVLSCTMIVLVVLVMKRDSNV